MKKMNEKRISKKVIAVIVAALIFGGSTFTAILLSAEADNAEAKEANAEIEKIVEEKAMKETEDAEAGKKVEVAEEAPAAGGTAKAVSENNNTNKSNASRSSNTNSSGNTGSSDSSKATGSSRTNTSTAPVHSHSWTAVYKTVSVPIQESYQVSVCNACGAEDSSVEHRKAHALAGEPSGFHSETRYRTVYTEQQQLSHYQCGCGATK